MKKKQLIQNINSKVMIKSIMNENKRKKYIKLINSTDDEI